MDKLELNEERYLRIRYVDQDGKLKQPTSESDDFVVLWTRDDIITDQNR